jgi:hypothetical protein
MRLVSWKKTKPLNHLYDLWSDRWDLMVMEVDKLRG